MIIPIDKTKRIRSDKLNWMIEHKTKKNWTVDTFHTTVVSALTKACQEEIKLIPDSRKLVNAIKDVDQIFEKYKNIMDNLPGFKLVKNESTD